MFQQGDLIVYVGDYYVHLFQFGKLGGSDAPVDAVTPISGSCYRCLADKPFGDTESWEKVTDNLYPAKKCKRVEDMLIKITYTTVYERLPTV